MKILHTTPAQDGFYMPAEFAPHEGCLMIWPERGDSWQYGAYAARKAFLRVIETISESESMTVLSARKGSMTTRVRSCPTAFVWS